MTNNVKKFKEIRERTEGLIDRGITRVLERGLNGNYKQAHHRLEIVKQAVNFADDSECFSRDEKRDFNLRYRRLEENLQYLKSLEGSDKDYRTIKYG